MVLSRSDVSLNTWVSGLLSKPEKHIDSTEEERENEISEKKELLVFSIGSVSKNLNEALKKSLTDIVFINDADSFEKKSDNEYSVDYNDQTQLKDLFKVLNKKSKKKNNLTKISQKRGQ